MIQEHAVGNLRRMVAFCRWASPALRGMHRVEDTVPYDPYSCILP